MQELREGTVRGRFSGKEVDNGLRPQGSARTLIIAKSTLMEVDLHLPGQVPGWVEGRHWGRAEERREKKKREGERHLELGKEAWLPCQRELLTPREWAADSLTRQASGLLGTR